MPGMIEQTMRMAPKDARGADRRRLHAGGHDPSDARHQQGTEHAVRARIPARRVRRVARRDRRRARSTSRPLLTGAVESTGSRRRSSTSATPRRTPRSSSNHERTSQHERQWTRHRDGGGRHVSSPVPRTQRFTLGEPRNLDGGADGKRVVFLRSARRQRPRQLRCGCSTSPPARSGSSPTPGRCSVTRTTTTTLTDAERGAARTAARGAREASRHTPPTPTPRWSRSPSGARCSPAA